MIRVPPGVSKCSCRRSPASTGVWTVTAASGTYGRPPVHDDGPAGNDQAQGTGHGEGAWPERAFDLSRARRVEDGTPHPRGICLRQRGLTPQGIRVGESSSQVVGLFHIVHGFLGDAPRT